MTLKDILQKIGQRHGIEKLNPMQKDMTQAKSDRVILLAPTGSGKTLAFAVPLISRLKPNQDHVQAAIIAPSRELALQIADVIRPIAKGYKTVALYGGHPMQEEVNSLTPTPDIVVATPGRLLDHLLRGTLTLDDTPALVLDEYDKALELGFHDQMRRIVKRMRSLKYATLTSATPLAEMPDFIDLSQARVIDYTKRAEAPRYRMIVTIARTADRDKLDALDKLLQALPEGKTIVFVNHRQSAERVHASMVDRGYPAGLYHGGLDQLQREIAVDLLNNGTTPLLISTDLGGRGLDIDDVQNVVHYHLPPTQENWTHRNGRTARVDADGNIFILAQQQETMPEYVDADKEVDIDAADTVADMPVPAHCPLVTDTATIYFNEGKKEKLSKGDVLGYLVKQCGLEPSDVGKIAVKDHCILAAVPSIKAEQVLDNGAKIKGKRVKITLLR